MDNVVNSIETSFKELVSRKQYRGITVKEICESAFVSRRTFYEKFENKQAIVDSLFYQHAANVLTSSMDLVMPEELRDIAPAIFTRFYLGIFDEREYYSNLVRPMIWTDSTFQHVVTNAFYRALSRFLESCRPLVPLDSKHLYYHAAGWANILQGWIITDYDVSPEQMGGVQSDILVPALEKLVELKL